MKLKSQTLMQFCLRVKIHFCVTALCAGTLSAGHLSCTSQPGQQTPSPIDDDDFARGSFERPSESQTSEPRATEPTSQESRVKETSKNVPDFLKAPGRSPLPKKSDELAGQAGFQCKDKGQFYDNGETFRVGCLVCRCSAGPRFSRVQCRELGACKPPVIHRLQ
jgi:hypothetical protein